MLKINQYNNHLGIRYPDTGVEFDLEVYSTGAIEFYCDPGGDPVFDRDGYEIDRSAVAQFTVEDAPDVVMALTDFLESL